MGVADFARDGGSDVRVQRAHRLGAQHDLVGVVREASGVDDRRDRAPHRADADRRDRVAPDGELSDVEAAGLDDVVEVRDGLLELAGMPPKLLPIAASQIPSEETRSLGPVLEICSEPERRRDRGDDEDQAREHAPYGGRRLSRPG